MRLIELLGKIHEFLIEISLLFLMLNLKPFQLLVLLLFYLIYLQSIEQLGLTFKIISGENLRRNFLLIRKHISSDKMGLRFVQLTLGNRNMISVFGHPSEILLRRILQWIFKLILLFVFNPFVLHRVPKSLFGLSGHRSAALANPIGIVS